MDWLIGKTVPGEETVEKFNAVVEEIMLYDHRSRFTACGTCFLERLMVYPQSHGARFRQLTKQVRKCKLGKRNTYTDQVDKLVKLAKLQLEKVMINKGIETLKYEISELNMEGDKIDSEIKDIINNTNGGYIRNILNFPNNKFPLVSFSIRKYNAHGYDIIGFDFPQINNNCLAIATLSSIVFSQVVFHYLF